MAFINPFRRRPNPTQEAVDRARDRAFELGEEERRRQQQYDKQARAQLNLDRQYVNRLTEAERELEWRRKLDEEELRKELEAVEIPPRVLTEEEAWAEGGDWYSGFTSSNVGAIQYDAEDERLLIQYLDGSIYAYHPVNMPMAIAFYRAPSKGTWVWDNLRVRGTVFGYKVPYELLSGPSQRTLGKEARKWMRSEESRRKHGQIPPSGRDYYGNPFKPRNIR